METGLTEFHSIARGIRLARKQLKMSQAEFAAALNASQGSVSKWESGKEVPRLETLQRIAALHPGFEYMPSEPRVTEFLHEVMDAVVSVPIAGYFMEGGPIAAYQNDIECRVLVPKEWLGRPLEAYLSEARSENERRSGGTKLLLVALFSENDTPEDLRRAEYLVGKKRTKDDEEELFLASMVQGKDQNSLWPKSEHVRRKSLPVLLDEHGKPLEISCRVIGVVIATTSYDLRVRADMMEPAKF
ncbi:transcriptional repressor DicA [compost metagenome]